MKQSDDAHKKINYFVATNKNGKKIRIPIIEDWDDSEVEKVTLPSLLEHYKKINSLLERLVDDEKLIIVNAKRFSDRIEFRNEKGQLHNENDEPAVIRADGLKCWYKNGKKHRDGDEPAAVYSSSSKYWYKHGKKHRDGDEPAIIRANGDKFWYKNGIPYRDGDKPAVIRSDGTREWYKNGMLHRDNDLPAVTYSNVKYWYKYGKRHRDDGKPAVIWGNGALMEYWVNGRLIKASDRG